MDVKKYLNFMEYTPKIKGNQELIIGEIIACFKNCVSIYLPFPNEFIIKQFERVGLFWTDNIKLADGMYFGTPTIVNNKPLFNPIQYSGFNKEYERQVVRNLCKLAVKNKLKKIVCGLGSGDITIENRLDDLVFGTQKIPQIVCYKDFGEFYDYVIEVNL